MMEALPVPSPDPIIHRMARRRLSVVLMHPAHGFCTAYVACLPTYGRGASAGAGHFNQLMVGLTECGKGGLVRSSSI